mgnify:CR=1 FL=1
MSDDKIAGAPAPAQEPAPAAEPAPAPAPVAAAPVQLELEPPPAPPVEKAKAAPDTPKPDPAVDGLRAELAEELERTRNAREAVEAISKRTIDRSRIEYLRKMGVSSALTDEHLLTLLPDVDPGTASGAQTLQAWRDGNSALFAKQEQGTVVTAKLIEKLKSSTHGTFGPEFHRAQMRATFGADDGR